MHLKVVVNFESIKLIEQGKQYNKAKIKFDWDMKNIDLKKEMILSMFTISNNNPLDFDYNAEWTNSWEIDIYLSNFTIYGNSQENLTVKFSS